MIGKNIIKIFAFIAFIIVSVTSQEAGDDKNLRNLVQLCGPRFPSCPKGQSCAPTGLCQSG